MTSDEWKKLLTDEGYTNIYVMEDGSNVHYSDHTHATNTAHAILSGEMILRIRGIEKTLHVGDRFDIPANTEHSATMGMEGCRYVVGE